MKSKMKLMAGPARVSARLLTATEIKDFRLEELKPPFTYGLVSSIGWDFKHTTEGNIIIFNINDAINLFPDTYIIDEKTIIAKFLQPLDNFESLETKPFGGFSL